MKVQTEPPRRPGGPRPKPNIALFEARMRAGMSRETLGHLAGVSAKQVGLIERGIATHSRAETLAGIADALHADIDTLFNLKKRI